MAKNILSLAAVVAYLAVVEYFWGWRELLAPWATVRPLTGLMIVGLMLLSYLLRALRLFDYYRDVPSGGLTTFVRIVLYHNFFNNLLPMRSGEISFPVLMARYCGIRPIHSLPALLWFRLLDLYVIASIGVAAAMFAATRESYWLALILPCLPLPLLGHVLHRRLERRLRTHPPGRVGAMLLQALQGLPRDGPALWRSVAWTWLNWLVKLAVLAEVLRFFLPLQRGVAWIGVIAGELTSVLPFHAPGGVGTYEAGVVAGLAPFAGNVDQAIPAAVNLHLFLLLASVLSAGAALLLGTPQRR